MDGSPSTIARPRLTPGIPAGGIAAVLIALGIIGWGLAAGDSRKEDGGDHKSFKITINDDGPEAPVPPAAPAAPAAPMPPMPHFDQRAVERAVERAQREIDRNATQLEALHAARQGLAAARESMRSASGNIPDAVDKGLRAAEARIDAKIAAATAATAGSAQDGVSKASFDAPQGISLVNLTGDVTITISNRNDKTSLEVEDGAQGVRTNLKDGVLTISQGNGTPGSIHLTLPESAAISVMDHVGDISIDGRTNAPVKLRMRRGDVSADRVGPADINILENGSISIDRVDGPLKAAIQGSGSLAIGRAETLALEVNGHGEVSVDRVNDATKISVPGYADVNINRVNGPVKVDFSGAGTLGIEDGRAEPLDVNLSGAGEVRFNGTAVNPRINATGAGSVHIARKEGNTQFSSSGSGSIHVGE
ncbi:DUF2807 domain-containing protein [Niveispirillum sp. BGYR6]|uniref:GIN domain-containing protein n=1 Tax=Niveispirillum sp. BGYR6 TaxID=2971249 RepID=UPI0022B96B15|nr:DUF2807 domain-containing protein [Niveispirillum sp. BGYR6]MDG5495792.1 DUF2807 domain-containing protein [Niveispirillum sp. BGYR6]